MPRDDQFEQSRVQVTMAVTDCLHRYARAVDRCDWDSVRACYHDNAFDHHGAYRGGVDGLIEDMKVRHAQLDSSVHFITNVIVDLPDPDVALVESYCLCYLRRREQEASGAQELTTVKCRYLDKFTPDAVGRWRIASRMVVLTNCVSARFGTAGHRQPLDRRGIERTHCGSFLIAERTGTQQIMPLGRNASDRERADPRQTLGVGQARLRRLRLGRDYPNRGALQP